MPQKPDPILFCWDADNTLINDHSHNFLSRLGVHPSNFGNSLIVNGELQPGGHNSRINEDYDINPVADKMNDFLDDHKTGLKNKEAISNSFAKLLDSGNKIAITSFTQYPDAVELLLDRLDLTPAQRDSIIVVTGFPPTSDGRNDPERKNYHIKAAMEMAGITDPKKVMLIDDDRKNTARATQAGYQTVTVPKRIDHAEYLSEVLEKAREMSIPTIEQPSRKQGKPAIALKPTNFVKPVRQDASPPLPPSPAPSSPTNGPLYQNLQELQQQVTPPPLPPRSPTNGPLYQNLQELQQQVTPPKTWQNNFKKTLAKTFNYLKTTIANFLSSGSTNDPKKQQATPDPTTNKTKDKGKIIIKNTEQDKYKSFSQIPLPPRTPLVPQKQQKKYTGR